LGGGFKGRGKGELEKQGGRKKERKSAGEVNKAKSRVWVRVGMIDHTKRDEKEKEKKRQKMTLRFEIS